MRTYRCDFEIFEDDGMWLALPLGMDGGTQGYTFDDAVDMACDWLRLNVEHAAIRGIDLEESKRSLPLEHGGTRVVICVPMGRECIDKVTATEAARILGISKARVSALIKDRKLEGWQEGRNTYVTRESVVARLSKPKPMGGRPKKRLPKITASL